MKKFPSSVIIFVFNFEKIYGEDPQFYQVGKIYEETPKLFVKHHNKLIVKIYSLTGELS